MTGPETSLLEALAATEHDGWSRWMKHLLATCIPNEDGSLTIPAQLAAEWQRQAEADYTQLSEEEKESDRAEVRRVLPLIQSAIGDRTDLGPV